MKMHPRLAIANGPDRVNADSIVCSDGLQRSSIFKDCAHLLLSEFGLTSFDFGSRGIKVTPRFAAANAPDCVDTDTIICGNSLQRSSIFKNSTYLQLREFGQVLLLSSGLATSVTHIGHVLFVRASTQVARVYTRTVVAAVQNVQTFGDWAVTKFIRGAMRAFRTKSVPDVVEPVASSSNETLPLPTIVGIDRNVNLVPEVCHITSLKSGG